MPNLESVRRIIGRDLIQRYVTEEGGSVSATGSFSGGIGSISLGFNPNLLIIFLEELDSDLNVFLVTPQAEIRFYDYYISDYNDNDRKTMRQNITVGTRQDFTITETGFNYDTYAGNGSYFAIE